MKLPLRLMLRLIAEPPFRLLPGALLYALPGQVRIKAKWDAVRRPQYLVGVLAAADEAAREGVGEISVLEFGVAGGNGLIALEKYAAAVAKETGVRISVYGFDSGHGLPQLCGDYRDHPELWAPHDFPMDEGRLRARLDSRTRLILGDVAETVPAFVQDRRNPPVGFAAMDLDLYSATRDALKILSLPDRRILCRVVMYFDDIESFDYHAFAGESLAITEFNAMDCPVKIDKWHGLSASRRPFPEAWWLDHMYVARDLQAISRLTEPFLARPGLELR